VAEPGTPLTVARAIFIVLAVASFLALFLVQRAKLSRPLLVVRPSASLLVPNGIGNSAGVRFRVVHRDRVSVVIVDAHGAVVRTLLRARAVRDKGLVDVAWDGRNDGGSLVRAGVYTPRVTLLGAGRSGTISESIRVRYRVGAR
jgi:flagellar hook capping protein FlgD